MRTKIALAALTATVLVLVPLTQGAGETQPCAATYDTTPPFTDYCYHQGVWYSPDTTQFDVLIVPAASALTLRDTQLAEDSVDMWDAGIQALGGPTISGLNIDAYTVGMEPVPEAALADPEVIVAPTTEANPFVLFGVAILHPINFCHGISPSVSTWQEVPGFHQHPDSPFGSFLASCASGGKMCYVVNTSFAPFITPNADNSQWMYDLISHEVGHCLTLGHVGDASTESTDDSIAYPHHDIMSYEDDGLRASTPHCVSNLNVKVIEKAFSSMLDPPGTTAVAPNPAAYVHMQPSSYSQPACPVSSPSYTDVNYLLGADPLGL